MPYIRVPKLSGSHPVVLDNAVQVRLFWTLNGIPCFNVLGGRVGGGYVNSQAHANSLTTAVLGRFNTSGLQADMADTTVLLGVGIRNLRVANEVEYSNLTTPATGTAVGQALPNQLAAVATLRTAKAGKSYRGRVYISGGDEAQNGANGTIAAGFNTDLLAFLNGVKTDMGTEGITMAVLSHKRYANLAPPADIETWAGAVTDVVSIETRDTQWDTQRRRRD